MKESTEAPTTPSDAAGQPGVGCERGLERPVASRFYPGQYVRKWNPSDPSKTKIVMLIAPIRTPMAPDDPDPYGPVWEYAEGFGMVAERFMEPVPYDELP